MKTILISIGTWEDMEPFLAIGEILKEKGHQVICAFPEQFKSLDLVHNTGYKKKSEQTGNQIDKEDFKEALYNSIVE